MRDDLQVVAMVVFMIVSKSLCVTQLEQVDISHVSSLLRPSQPISNNALSRNISSFGSEHAVARLPGRLVSATPVHL